MHPYLTNAPVLPPEDVRELFDILRQYQKGTGPTWVSME